MIRFANPGSNIGGLIRIFLELFQALSPDGNFDLDDMTETLIRRNLATSSGYMGEEALARSTRPDRSRDPLYNQSKMYSELFKLLGWMHPTPEGALIFRFTLLGAHVAAAVQDPRALISESILGVVFPNPVLGSQGDYQVRPFLTLLRAAEALNGTVSRDEMIAGPLSLIDDRDSAAFDAMISDLKQVRGDWDLLRSNLVSLSEQRGITLNTMWNYTRFPIAILK